MVGLDYITQEQADSAASEELGITVSVSDITAPHFVMWVKEQLVNSYSEREVEEGGILSSGAGALRREKRVDFPACSSAA